MQLSIKSLYMILLMGLTIKTFGQNNKKRKVEKFDIKKLIHFKTENKVEDTLSDGSIVKYFEDSKEIQETVTEPNSVYINVKQYFKETLLLKREEHFFYEMPIGVMKVYDVSGNLISEVNYETIFKFSLDDIHELLLKKYSINIFKDKNFGILRHFYGTPIPYYEVHILSGMQMRVIHINGINGEIIDEKEFYIER